MTTALETIGDVSWLAASKPARLEQYLGLWLLEQNAFRAHWQRVRQMDLHVHIKQADSMRLGNVMLSGSPTRRGPARDLRHGLYRMAGTVAIVGLTGLLMKVPSSLGPSTSTVFARRQVRVAAADSEVSAICIKIDSAGGTLAGTADLADDIRAAAKKKPLVAYIEDTGCASAYWLACACPKIYSNSTAAVGSIGTYMTVVDSSKQAKDAGLVVNIVKAGKFKAAGLPGTPVTREQLDAFQGYVDAINREFVKAVAIGRHMTPAAAAKLANGQVHVASSEGVRLGLVDKIQSLDATLKQLAAAVK